MDAEVLGSSLPSLLECEPGSARPQAKRDGKGVTDVATDRVDCGSHKVLGGVCPVGIVELWVLFGGVEHVYEVWRSFEQSCSADASAPRAFKRLLKFLRVDTSLARHWRVPLRPGVKKLVLCMKFRQSPRREISDFSCFAWIFDD